MNELFPIIKLSGSAEERGEQHGRLLKERIERTIDFYQRQFLLPQEEILAIAARFQQATEALPGDLALEIAALAQAAEVDPRWIYALHGRTELLNLNPLECTTLAFKEQRLVGQNWDWDREIEELAVILDIEKPDGQRILTMSEPGMIAKIGMNNQGLAVCLNFLDISGYQAYGPPLHVLLRMILDSPSLEGALQTITPHLPGKVGNLLLIDRTGRVEDLELAGDVHHAIPVGERFAHTNHFLADVEYDPVTFPHSIGRYTRACQLLETIEIPSIEAIKLILKDRGNDDYPICRKAFSHGLLADDSAMTVCSIIMDLEKLEFHITRGNPFDHPYSVFSLQPPA